MIPRAREPHYAAGMRIALMVVALAGCSTSSGGGEPPDAAPPDAGSPDAPDVQAPVLCPASITLAPGTPSTPASMEVGPFELGTASLCLHLDTRGLIRGHFAASTSRESGSASSFVLTLADANGTTLVDGWDVTVGTQDPTSFANLEMAMEADLERDVVLTISAKADGAPITDLGLSLFDPLL
jgi:hypothetical protein